MNKKNPTIAKIEKFWDDNPLFTGEVELNTPAIDLTNGTPFCAVVV